MVTEPQGALQSPLKRTFNPMNINVVAGMTFFFFLNESPGDFSLSFRLTGVRDPATCFVFYCALIHAKRNELFSVSHFKNING